MSLDVTQALEARMKEQIEAKTRMVVIEEVKIDGEPLTMHIYPMTAGDLQKIIAEPDQVERAIVTIVTRARLEDGKKMFSIHEKNTLRDNLEGNLLRMIAGRINEDMKWDEEADDRVKVLGKS